MTNQTVSRILIVDDDEAICKTFSAILQAEGYQTTTATTAKEAIKKTKAQFFNIALLDIKLPDMEGTKLLAQLQEITPDTVKIMITGYPSLKNAVEALNYGADSYIMKPIDPAELLKTIKNKLETKLKTERITKEKLAEWVQSLARKAQTSDFQQFLEETSSELAYFGLTKTQAKIYITTTALGIASASEIAKLSKIRREEVYRIIPELEKRGIIARRIEVPRKFSAVQPETATQLLVQNKMKTMKEEIENIRQKQADFVAKLKAIELPIRQNDDCSIEVISQPQSLFTKIASMVENTKQQIDIIAPLEDLRLVYVNCPRKLMDKTLKTVKMRIITEDCELDAFTKETIQLSETHKNPIKLRQIEKPPFRLIITDDKEAMWSKYQPTDANTQTFYTDDPTQITILKTSFENLWQKP